MRKKNTTPADIADFLNSTGFIFEMEIAKILKSRDYNVYPNEHFLDIEEDKNREIDIIATKIVNDIRILLVIECKQSLNDDWIFICSKEKPSRYYETVKHLPKIMYQEIKENKVFDSLHFLDKKKPLAQNYISHDKHTKKKGNSEQIVGSLFKLPKAVIGTALRVGVDKRAILLPIVVFSGKMFTLKYNDQVIINEVGLVQIEQAFDKEIYGKKIQTEDIGDRLWLSRGLSPKEKIASMAQTLDGRFIIDFVNKSGLIKYITMIEREIKKIPTEKWPLKTKSVS